MSLKLATKRMACAGIVLAGLALAACSGEDRPTVDVINDGTPGGTGSVSGPGGAGPAPTRAPGATGYSVVSNVDIYFNQLLDLRDMRNLMQPATQGQPVDWAAVAAIYEQGKNAIAANGSPRSFASLINESVLAVFPNSAAIYGTSNFVDRVIRDGLTGSGRGQGISDDARRQIVDKGVQMLIYAKAMQEMDAAKTRVAQRNLDNNTGAPHAVDEAWAIVAGAPNPDGSRPHGLLQTAIGREGNFKLEGKLRQPLEDAFVAALAASQKGDVPAFDKAYNDVKGHLNAIFYLGSLRYVKVAESATSAAQRQVQLAEGWTFFQAIRAGVASGSAGAAQTVEGAYTRNANEAVPASATTGVYEALNQPQVLQALAIPSALVVRTPPAN